MLHVLLTEMHESPQGLLFVPHRLQQTEPPEPPDDGGGLLPPSSSPPHPSPIITATIATPIHLRMMDRATGEPGEAARARQPRTAFTTAANILIPIFTGRPST